MVEFRAFNFSPIERHIIRRPSDLVDLRAQITLVKKEEEEEKGEKEEKERRGRMRRRMWRREKSNFNNKKCS